MQSACIAWAKLRVHTLLRGTGKRQWRYRSLDPVDFLKNSQSKWRGFIREPTWRRSSIINQHVKTFKKTWKRLFIQNLHGNYWKKKSDRNCYSFPNILALPCENSPAHRAFRLRLSCQVSPSIFTASISQPNRFLPSPKEKASFSMKIMCYNLSLNRNTLNINENWCEITIPTKYKPYLKASKHPEIDWSNARVPPFHRPALRRCSKDFTVFPGSVEAGGAWILLVGRNSMRWFSPGWGLGVGDWWWLMIIGWEDHVISKSVSLSFKGTVINGRSYWMGTY